MGHADDEIGQLVQEMRINRRALGRAIEAGDTDVEDRLRAEWRDIDRRRQALAEKYR